MKLPKIPQDSIRADTAVNLFNLLIFLFITGSMLILLAWELNRFVLDEAEEKAQILLNHNLAIHSYYNHVLKPAVFAMGGDSLDAAYFDPVWMSSTYAVREIDQIFRQSDTFTNYYYKEAAINARSPQNEADSYEREVLAEMSQNPDHRLRSSMRVIDGRPYYVVMLRGESMEAACLRCHSEPVAAPAGLIAKYGAERSFQRKAGDLVSVISIRIPMGAALAGGLRRMALWSAVLVAALILLFYSFLVIQKRYLRAPLDVIRNTAQQISTDNSALGQKIPVPFGKEFVELAGAFNLMSTNLRRHQDELENQVAQRTKDLSESRRFIDGILNTTPNIIFLTDRLTGRVIYRNHEFGNFFGASPESEILIGDISAAAHPDDQAVFAAHCHRLTEAFDGQIIQSVFRFKHAAGEWRWLNLRSVVYRRSDEGSPYQLLHMSEDVTERYEAQKRLEFMSSHDHLTGLYNRAKFEEKAEKVWVDGKHAASVLIIDVDNLKAVNDQLGHARGDELLRRAADSLKAVVRESDITARIGGDEFAVLLFGVNEKHAGEIKTRIQNVFADEIKSWGVDGLGLSIGISAVEPRLSLIESIRRADERMYREKNRRKRHGSKAADQDQSNNNN